MVDAHWLGALRQALAPPCLRCSLGVALIVGTLLNAINQGDLLLASGEVSVVKMVLTYAVPFCVATFGAYSMARSAESEYESSAPVTAPDKG